MKVPFQISTGIGESKSTQFSSEQSRNVIGCVSETNNRLGVCDFPGLKLYSAGSGADRGDHVMGSTRYLINGNSLIKEVEGGTRTTLGTVAGTDRAIFADNGTVLYFVANGAIYKYNGSTVTTVSQSAVTNPTSIVFINDQFIISGNGGFFAVSDALNGDTYNTLNQGSENSKSDGLLRVFEFNSLIYMCGSDSIIPWYNSGAGNPPFDRQQSSLINVGLASKHGITKTKRFMYSVSPDREIMRGVGSAAEPIQSEGAAEKIKFIEVDDCIASSFVWKKQQFVIFKFPSNGVTLLYSETYDYWVELSSGTDKNAISQWYGNAARAVYGKVLFTDYRNGNTYELDEDTYTDNSDTRLRVITTRSFTSNDIGIPDRHIIAKQLRLNCQVGVGLATGQGSDPVIMCQFSQEGGEIWLGEGFVGIGTMGEYTKLVDFWSFAAGYEIKARIMISDPVYFCAYGGTIDLEDAGH